MLQNLSNGANFGEKESYSNFTFNDIVQSINAHCAIRNNTTFAIAFSNVTNQSSQYISGAREWLHRE